MTNLTFAIDQDVLRWARIRALEEGLTANALPREYPVVTWIARERTRATPVVAPGLVRTSMRIDSLEQFLIDA